MRTKQIHETPENLQPVRAAVERSRRFSSRNHSVALGMFNHNVKMVLKLNLMLHLKSYGKLWSKTRLPKNALNVLNKFPPGMF